MEQDLDALLPLPPVANDACDKQVGRVSSLSLVRYRTNGYSVPVAYGHRDVLVKGYVDQVVISCGSEVIAKHSRSYDMRGMIISTTPFTTCRCWSGRLGPWTKPLHYRGGSYRKISPSCVVSLSPGWAGGASASTCRC